MGKCGKMWQTVATRAHVKHIATFRELVWLLCTKTTKTHICPDFVWKPVILSARAGARPQRRLRRPRQVGERDDERLQRGVVHHVEDAATCGAAGVRAVARGASSYIARDT